MSDKQAVFELKASIDNDGDLYKRMTLPVLKNLVGKKARGQYKHDLAVKAFGYLTEAGAKKYAQGYSVPWHKMFDAATRKLAAEGMAEDFEREFALGGYRYLLPKKYQEQKKVSPSVQGRTDHARKKPETGTSEKSIRVEILDSGDSKYFRPGQFGYVIGSDTRGGNHTLDRGVSNPGELTYLVSKSKGAGGGALWFSSGALRFTGRGGTLGAGVRTPHEHARKKTSFREMMVAPRSWLPVGTGTVFSHDDLKGTVSLNGKVIAARTSRGWTPTGVATGNIAHALSTSIFALPNDVSAGGLRRQITDILRPGGPKPEPVSGGHSDHSRKKQLDREILHVVPSYRWRS